MSISQPEEKQLRKNGRIWKLVADDKGKKHAEVLKNMQNFPNLFSFKSTVKVLDKKKKQIDSRWQLKFTLDEKKIFIESKHYEPEELKSR